jgi:hypothetical protein
MILIIFLIDYNLIFSLNFLHGQVLSESRYMYVRKIIIFRFSSHHMCIFPSVSCEWYHNIYKTTFNTLPPSINTTEWATLTKYFIIVKWTIFNSEQ